MPGSPTIVGVFRRFAQPARRTLPIFVAAGVIIIASAVADYWMDLRVHSADQTISHHEQVIVGLEDLLSTLKDAETGQRGFLLTGDERYLDSYHGAAGRIDRQLDRLANWSKDGDVSPDLAAAVARLIRAQLAELNRTIDTRREKGFEAARAMVRTDVGKRTMDDLRHQVKQMEDRQQARLSAARARQDSAILYRTLMTIGILLLTLLFFAWAFHRIQQGMATVERQRRLLAVTLASIGDGVIVTDGLGRVTFLNAEAERLTGWMAQQASGQALPAVFKTIHQETRQVVENPVDKVLRLGAVVAMGNHTVLIARDGRELPIDDTAAPVRSAEGTVHGVVLVFRDVGERRRAEQDLARSNKDLAQFASIASHDLQEPLRMVTGFLTILRDRWRGRLDAKADECIDHAMDGAERMAALIKDLLAYSRVGNAGMETQPIALRPALDQALAMLAQAVRESGAQITIADLPTIFGNRGQLAQVFQNLIGNAIKFRSPRPLQIEIGSRRETGQWLVWVKDNGIGLDPQHSQRVFDLFERLHSRDQYPGTGIGLAVCKKIIERHGGRVWVEAQPDQGSTFFFSLPADAE